MAKLTRLYGVVIVLLAFSFSLAGTALAASSPSCGGWSVVSSPNIGTKLNELSSIAAISANDMWAVGSTGHRTLTEHWNGTKWSIVKSPSLRFSTSLSGVSALSTDDVWAVGYSQEHRGNKYKYQTLAEHWNGNSWSIISTPNPTNTSALTSVSAISSNDIWAVGWVGCCDYALVEHWDGTQWSVVSTPHQGTSFLYAATAISPNDVWAGGIVYGSYGQTLTEHWNGTQWSVVSSPNEGTVYNYINSMSALSTNDVWAVGYYFNPGQSFTLIEHWNGTQWSIVKSPATAGYVLNGVAAIASNNVWAVGGNGSGQALIEQWSGTKWRVVPSPNPGGTNGLSAVTQVPSTAQLWAVGVYQAKTLIEFYC